MPDPATSGQATAQPAAGGAASAGETSTTVLGGEAAAASTTPQGEAAAKPAAAAAAGAKPGEVKPGEKPGEATPAAKAPETYAEFKVPQGMTVDKAMVEAYSPVMRELNLTQDQAQKLVDVFATQQQAQTQTFEKQLEDESFAMGQAGELLGGHREKWAEALKADKEIGGANFEANTKVAQRAIARFGSSALKQALNATGLGNHPEFVRFCLKVGQRISEDTPLPGSAGGSGRKASEDVFYGGQSAS